MRNHHVRFRRIRHYALDDQEIALIRKHLALPAPSLRLTPLELETAARLEAKLR